MIDSILEVSIQANKGLIKEWRGDVHLCHALLEIMEPEIKRFMAEGKEEGVREGIKEGIKNLILTLCELGMNREDTKDIVSKRYPLTEEELDQYLEEFF